MQGTRGPAVLCMLLLALARAESVTAQAWVRQPGGIYAKSSFNYFFTREEFNFEGVKQPIFADQFSRTDVWFRDMSVNTYVEYGITRYTTLVAKLPFKMLTSSETENAGPGFPLRRITRTNGGVGDLTLLLRMPLITGSFGVVIQYGGSIPTGYEKEPENGGPALGTGSLSGELELDVGRSFYPWPAYASSGVGYRRRQGPLHDEVFYNLEAGLTPGRFLFKLRLDGLQNTYGPPDLATAGNDAIVGDRDFFKLSGEIDWRLGGPLSVAAEFFNTFAGKNTTAGTAYAVGLVIDMN